MDLENCWRDVQKKPSTVAQTTRNHNVRVISLVSRLLLITELQHAPSFNVHLVYNVFSTFKLIWMSMNFHGSLWNRFFRQLFTHHYGGVWETYSRERMRRTAFTRKNVEENQPRLDETRFVEQRCKMKTMFKEKRQKHEIYGSAGWYFWFLLVLYSWRSLDLWSQKQCKSGAESGPYGSVVKQEARA